MFNALGGLYELSVVIIRATIVCCFVFYFITTFDVTVWGPMGIWMDWGCQVVGPSFGSSAAGDVNVWHINPLGAGGMRMSF